MDEKSVELFYEIIGYVQAYTNYLVLLLFVLKPKKIFALPFSFFFINAALSVVFDTIALVFHENDSWKPYLSFLNPLYAVNNICFIGLFLGFYIPSSSRVSFKTMIAILSIVALAIYHFNGYETWAVYGSAFQSVVMISLLCIGLRYIYARPKINNHQRSALYIVLGLLFAFSLSFLINLLLKSMIETDLRYSLLFYGIKNIFWVISNLLSAYAVYQLRPTPKPVLSSLFRGQS